MKRQKYFIETINGDVYPNIEDNTIDDLEVIEEYTYGEGLEWLDRICEAADEKRLCKYEQEQIKKLGSSFSYVMGYDDDNKPTQKI